MLKHPYYASSKDEQRQDAIDRARAEAAAFLGRKRRPEGVRLLPAISALEGLSL
jgi:hypothetical protein